MDAVWVFIYLAFQEIDAFKTSVKIKIAVHNLHILLGVINVVVQTFFEIIKSVFIVSQNHVFSSNRAIYVNYAFVISKKFDCFFIRSY